jgi:hypothetical protein
MNIEEYKKKLFEDKDFFILETQIQLSKNPYFFELIKDPYDKESYYLQENEIILALIEIYENNIQ